MLRAVLNKPWKQNPTKQQLYVHLPPILQTIQVRRTRHDALDWRSKDYLISDVLQWTHGHTNANQLITNYMHQLFADTRFSLEDLSGVMNDKDSWKE